MHNTLQSFADLTVGEVTFFTPHYELQGKTEILFLLQMSERIRRVVAGVKETDTSNTQQTIWRSMITTFLNEFNEGYLQQRLYVLYGLRY